MASRLDHREGPGRGAPVAGFDLTFSPSKSISVVWALADEETRAVIYECHEQAIKYVISYAERESVPLGFLARTGSWKRT